MTVDDAAWATGRLSGGGIVQLEVSRFALGAKNGLTLEIYGEKGVIIQDYGDGPSCGAVAPPPDAVGVKIFRASEPEKGFQPLDVPVPPGHGARIHGVARPMVNWLKDESAPPPCPLEEALGSVHMCLGAYESAGTGCRVALPLAQ